MSELHNESIARETQAAPADPGQVLSPCCTLEGFALEPGCAEGVLIQSLEPGTVLVVRTQHSTYRLVVEDGSERHVLVTGGTLFPESTPVRVAGATAGGSTLKMGWIGVGLNLEMWSGRRRITTSPVESISTEAPARTH